jgi:CheY-like chemotaxis protein
MKRETKPKSDQFSKVKSWTGEEFLGRDFPPKEPLVEGLLHRRDLVCLAARRRNGKTSLLTDLAVSLAVPATDFIGYPILDPRRSLLLILEDDSGEFQEKLRKVIGDRTTKGRIRIITRDDFLEAGLSIDVREEGFREAVRKWVKEHKPDLIVIDNLAHVIDADYSDPKRIHELMQFCYQLAKEYDAAVILAAHPRKDDGEHPVSLRISPTQFFEAVMGSSHFVNSTGSLWGLERPELEEYSVFLGGRQRGNGQQQACFISMDDQGRFELLPEAEANLPLVLNTQQRQAAWANLPGPPGTFTYTEGER